MGDVVSGKVWSVGFRSVVGVVGGRWGQWEGEVSGGVVSGGVWSVGVWSVGVWVSGGGVVSGGVVSGGCRQWDGVISGV